MDKNFALNTMEPKQKTIVIIEDDRNVILPLARAAHQAGYEPVLLYTFEEAQDYLSNLTSSDASHIVAVIFDFILKHFPEITSVPLVGVAKQRLNSHVILLANSSEERCNGLLRKAGCTHTRPGNEKKTAVIYLLELLKEN